MNKINPDDFVAWLITQQNLHGSLYLERVARHYARYLRTAPLKLDITLSVDERDVFACISTVKFDEIRNAFLAAPNYKAVNGDGHQSFSAGMTAYRRYLESLETQVENIKGEAQPKMGAVATVVAEQAYIAVCHVDFKHPELCTFTDPLECSIGDKTIRGVNWNWRDLLFAITEHFIRVDESRVKSFVLQSGRPFLLRQKPANTLCRQLSNHYFIVVSVDIPQLVRFIGNLCVHCGVDLDKIKITYTAKANTVISRQSTEAKKQERVVEDETSAFADIVDFEYGRDKLRSILNTHFQMLYGYSHNNILWDAAQNELSMFLNDNAINTPKDLWDFVCRVFGCEFVMTNWHIWQKAPDYPQNSRGLIINLARQYGGTVTREKIDDYFIRIKVSSPTNAVVLTQNNLVFCDGDRFIPTASLNLTDERCKEITTALSDLFACENAPYIVPRDIRQEWFSRLPELASANWTTLLLQEVLRVQPSIGYRVILPNLKGQKYDTLGAAIVPSNSYITTFADVAHRYCYARWKLPHDIQAEDLRLELQTAGMVEGNELIYNMHKALHDHRFAFDSEKQKIKILER